jgi:Heavy-metal resistance
MAASRKLTCCNLLPGLGVYILEKGGDGMKKWMKNSGVLSFLLAVIVTGGVWSAEADGFGHRSDAAALEMMSSLGLSEAEQAALTSALSTYGPAVKTAWQQLRAAREQMKTDTETTSPDGSQVATDGTALASAKAQLKAARAQLNSALLAALTPDHLRQLKAQLTAQFQSRLDENTGRVLANHARSLEKQ